MKAEVLEKYKGYSVVTGSTLYGLNTESSDRDVKSVVRLPDAYGYTLARPWETETLHEPDVEYHSFLKFVRLLVTQAPSALEMVFAPDYFVQCQGVVGTRLRESAAMFLSKGYKNAACGFADSFMLKVKESVAYHEQAPSDDLAQLSSQRVEASLSRVLEESAGRNLPAGVRVDFYTESGLYLPSEELLLRVDAEEVSASSLRAVLSDLNACYANLMKRKSKYVTVGNESVRKDVMQAVRLKYTACRTLQTGVFDPSVAELRSDLLALRAGKFTWKQVFDWDAELTLQVNEAYKTTSLPLCVDDTFVNDFVRNVMEETRC